MHAFLGPLCQVLGASRELMNPAREHHAKTIWQQLSNLHLFLVMLQPHMTQVGVEGRAGFRRCGALPQRVAQHCQHVQNDTEHFGDRQDIKQVPVGSVTSRARRTTIQRTGATLGSICISEKSRQLLAIWVAACALASCMIARLR